MDPSVAITRMKQTFQSGLSIPNSFDGMVLLPQTDGGDFLGPTRPLELQFRLSSFHCSDDPQQKASAEHTMNGQASPAPAALIHRFNTDLV